MLSQKCQYGLRAVFELARHYGKGPIKIADIAAAQAIPPRFLEVILSQLKQGGFVDSRRGASGGYELKRSPGDLAVGEVIRFIEGPIGPVMCLTGQDQDNCRLRGNCVFLGMWEKAGKAIAQVYDGTTFGGLVEEDRLRKRDYVSSYAI
ncbi:MAG: Rrf2 family transcriptional regulator [Acidobacteria bacterium]|nr:Rrf2 family transcriptional regulator [Acidobacteriota bacterium]